MKTGRNDSCPCGSGKKYKKCCLQKDQAAEHAEFARGHTASLELVQSAPARTPPQTLRPEPVSRPPAPKPPDPRMDAINARWEEFQAATAEEQPDIYIRTLDDPELMDDEMAFEMLSQLHKSAVKSGERDRWSGLAEQLRERHPDVYAISSKYYLSWMITDAIVSRRPDRVRVLACESAETAGDDADVYSQILDRLTYHGHLTALAEAMQIAWPLIKTSSSILWGQREFAVWGADCVLFERLERNGELDGRDPELIELVRFYFEDLDLDYFAGYVDRLTRRTRMPIELKKNSVGRRWRAACVSSPVHCDSTERIVRG